MRRFWKNQQGVTMIEVLVTIAILAIVVVPCLSAFVMAQRGNVKAAETTNAYTAAANLMEELKGSQEKREEVFQTQTNHWNGENITAFYADENGYYIVTIYLGEHSAVPSEVPPILKGVIVP